MILLLIFLCLITGFAFGYDAGKKVGRHKVEEELGLLKGIKKNEGIKEGRIFRGGINKKPTTPKPFIRPPSRPNRKPTIKCGSIYREDGKEVNNG